jgi:hypothetical protein
MRIRPAAALFGALLLAAPLTVTAASVDNKNVPTGEGDAIFVVGEGGYLEPIALRRNGTFMNPGSNEGGPSDKLRMESNAAIVTHGNKVHIIFGARTIATVPAKVENGAATIPVPPQLHLNANINALASPTLNAHAASARRAPSPAERAAALAIAAKALGTTASHLDVQNLTALDLGHGPAFAGTVNLRGIGTPRTDKRLFFIAERTAGTLHATLTNLQTIRVTEPLLEEIRETLVDAIDLGDGKLCVVTRQLGYDAHTYNIYARTPTSWKVIYSGGGAAM